ASAVREAYEMQPSPELLRAVYQAAYMVQYVRRPGKTLLDLPPEKRESISSPDERVDWSDIAESTDEQLCDRLIEEVEARKHIAAMRTARGYLETGRPASKLTAKLIKYAFSDSASVPIMLAHTIKTTVAAVEESKALDGHPLNWLPIAAAVRFLASPKRERW